MKRCSLLTAKWLARGVFGVLLMLALATCDGPTPQSLVCGDSGGTTEYRPLLDGSSGTIAVCVFAGGVECYDWQMYDGTCIPPGADAPITLERQSTPPADYNPMVAPTFGYFYPPASLDELLGRAALIFTGEVGPVKQYLEIIGYSEETGQLELPSIDADGRRMVGTPVTDFHLYVDEVIRDDGTIAAGIPIILRVMGHVTKDLKQPSLAGEYPVTYTGDRYLFVLTPFPDGETYGFLYGPWSRLIVDGEILRTSRGKQQPLQFADEREPVTLDELIRYAEINTPPTFNAPTAVALSSGFGIEVVPPPESLDELVGKSSLIVFATVGDIVRYFEFDGYRGDGQLQGFNDFGTRLTGIPMSEYAATDFYLFVDRVIRDDGRIAAGKPVVLRMPGHSTMTTKLDSEASEYPASYTSDYNLFLLTANPDGYSYGLAYGPWSRLIVEGNTLRVTDGAKSPLRFGDTGKPVTLDEFVQFVEMLSASDFPTPIPDSGISPPVTPDAPVSPAAMPSGGG